ncbi:MAG: hypothetical protein Q7S15_02480 [bacterium]|nr:hypothetical protein [bacterium]
MPAAEVQPKKEDGNGVRLEEDFFGFSASFTSVPNYSNFWASVQLVREHQSNIGWNPIQPSAKLSIMLMREIRRYLGRERSNLRLCCALGSQLDLYHGIDGFFYLEPIRNFIVSFDLSENWEKKSTQKAHFLISRGDLLNPHSLSSLAQNIAKRLTLAKKRRGIVLEVRVS